MAALQKIAKGVRSKDARRNHALAAALWKAGWYETRTVAIYVEDAANLTPAQLDEWVRDFDNWAICDTACFKLFDQVAPELAFRKIQKWSKSRAEFVKRAGIVLMACVALHNRSIPDEELLRRLPLLEEAATDERNFVKKGVSWALRGVGRRSAKLKAAVLSLAQRLGSAEGAAPRWIGKDVVRELGGKASSQRSSRERGND